MPRVTRAALRAEEELSTATITNLPMSPLEERMPLGEISDNKGAQRKAIDIEPGANCAEGSKSKAKKRTVSKKARKQVKVKVKEPAIDIHEDGNENQSQTNPAVDEASYLLINETSKEHGKVLCDDEPILSPSIAVKGATKKLLHGSSMQQSNEESHIPEDIAGAAGSQTPRDLSVAKMEIVSPSKVFQNDASTLPQVDGGENNDEEDSFVEQIKTRTPAKRSSRIEDSVAALDALEEDIERVGKEIPATGSPSWKMENGNTDAGGPTAKRNTSLSNGIASAPPAATSCKRTGMNRPGSMSLVRPDDNELKSRVHRTTHSKHEPKSNSTATTSKPAYEKGELQRRVSVLQKAPFQPLKSTKAPTRAAFELPGEAVARKLKEQREERHRRDEEENCKQTSFKARPVRHGQAPEVKLNAAAKARLGRAKMVKQDSEPSKPVAAANETASATNVTRSPFGLNKRSSTLKVPKRPLEPSRSGFASQSASISVGRKVSINHGAMPPTRPAEGRPAPTAEDLAHRKLKGKEIFSRTKVSIMEKDKARKEKEDAARKARLDAAERGRIASRAWAEKQRLRKMADAKGKENATSTLAVD